MTAARFTSNVGKGETPHGPLQRIDGRGIYRVPRRVVCSALAAESARQEDRCPRESRPRMTQRS